MFPEPGEKSGEPQFYTDAEKKEFQVAQRGVKQVLDEVLARWNIDQNHIFVMGNSMGSCVRDRESTAVPAWLYAAAQT